MNFYMRKILALIGATKINFNHIAYLLKFFVIHKRQIIALVNAFLLLAVCLAYTVNIPKQMSIDPPATCETTISFELKTENPKIFNTKFYYTENKEESFKEEKSFEKIVQVSEHFAEHTIVLPVWNELKELRFDPTIEPADFVIRNMVIGGKNIDISPENISYHSDISIVKYDLDRKELILRSTGYDPYILFSAIPDDVSYKYYGSKNLMWFYKFCLYVKSKIFWISTAVITLACLCLSSFILWSIITSLMIFSLYYFAFYNELLEIFRGDILGTYYKIGYQQFSVILVMVLLATLSAFLHKFKSLRFICWLLGIFLILLVASDVFSYMQFNTRITPSDVFKYTKNTFDSSSILADFIKRNPLIVVSAILGLFAFTRTCFCKIKKNDVQLATIISSLGLLLFVILPPAAKTLWDNHYVSIFEGGTAVVEAKMKYSPNSKYYDFVANTKEALGQGTRKNVILLIVESLSSDESRFFGGRFDNTPNIDRIAELGISFLNYSSNGFNTDTGNFSIFTQRPFVFGGKNITDEGLYDLALPKLMDLAGYRTDIFFSAAAIGDLSTIWDLAGFKNKCGGDDLYYNSSERLTFNSVPDRDLLNNVIRHLKQMNNSEPYFAAIMTTTTHAPYIVPGTHNKNFHETVRYVDGAVGEFYKQLSAAGFFDNGILIITGDHRAMLPYTSEENDRNGDIGITRVPLIIIDSSYDPVKITQYSSHVDLGNMLQYLTLSKTKYYEFNHNPLIDIDEKDRNLVIYQYHNPENEVLLYDSKLSQNNTYLVRLKGDDTTIVGCEDCDVAETDYLLGLIRWLRN